LGSWGAYWDQRQKTPSGLNRSGVVRRKTLLGIWFGHRRAESQTTARDKTQLVAEIAAFTSSATFFSTVGVHFRSAYATGHRSVFCDPGRDLSFARILKGGAVRGAQRAFSQSQCCLSPLGILRRAEKFGLA
jgi:hypothetical protein